MLVHIILIQSFLTEACNSLLMTESTVKRGQDVAMAILKYPIIPENVPASELPPDTSTSRLWTGSQVVILHL